MQTNGPVRVPVFHWPFGRALLRPPKPETKDRVPDELLELATLTAAAALERLRSRPSGLTAGEVSARRDAYGANLIAHEEHETLPAQLLRRLLNPLNLLLMTLALVSYLMDDHQAAALIITMVVLSLTLALVQERRSSAAAQRLRAMVHTTVMVLRSKQEGAGNASVPSEPLELPLEQLVPGDIVHLSAGDMIPGDLRLTTAKDLFVNQAPLTGESLPVEKHAEPQSSPGAQIGSLINVCFMGTTVVSGTATGVIALTGERAYFGGVAHIVASARTLTSFDKGINRFAWLMI